MTQYNISYPVNQDKFSARDILIPVMTKDEWAEVLSLSSMDDYTPPVLPAAFSRDPEPWEGSVVVPDAEIEAARAAARAAVQPGLSSSHISPLPIVEPATGEVLPARQFVEKDFWVQVDSYDDDGYEAPIYEVKTARVPVEAQGVHTYREARAIVHVDGSLVQVQNEAYLPRGGPSSGGGKRGKAQFSLASRRRLMRTVSKTNREDRPLFVTLTYPDVYPKDEKKWKRDIDVLGKRLRRAFPKGAFIWRMEIVPRRSGENAGSLAPHFHLLVWGVPYISLREWLPLNWYQVADLGDPKHLVAGTSVEYVRSWSGVMHYCGKYIAKEVSEAAGSVGRWWGIVGREFIPWSAVVEISLSVIQAVRAVRVGRKKIGMVGKSLKYGLTWMMKGDRFLDYLEWAEV